MDNLPIPQSRIEELMNAFISRDSSQISTPQSRIEEFWYHLIEGTNALPIPQSRIELLLKKIIENDTKQIPLAKSRAEEFLVSILTGDINKLPIPQSRSEYYLDYIARNNLVLDDIEYVKYSDTNITASNTVQKPFRSAILTGQTLVNIKEGVKETEARPFIKEFFIPQVQKNTDYLIKYNTESSISDVKDVAIGFLSSSNQWSNHNENGPLNGTIILNSGNNPYCFRFNGKNTSSSLTINSLMIIEYQDGMENWDIPYFEGMQSVKMPVLTTTGKNLFNKNDVSYNTKMQQNLDDIYDENHVSSNFIKVSPETNYYISGLTVVVAYDENKKYISILRDSIVEGTFLTPKNCKYIRLRNWNLLLEDEQRKIVERTQLEYGTIKTPYEPHKSNILSASEDVELRGIGGVQDELDLLTGEVTERIGEIVLNGSDEQWTLRATLDNVIYFRLTKKFDNFNSNVNQWHRTTKCNKFISMAWIDSFYLQLDKEFLSNDGANYPVISIGKEKLSSITVDGFKQWLSQNPITIQYQLATESIKTVDLKVVDQDGNPVKQLSAFDETTHIVSSSASDNSLIAIAEVEVPTKLIEALDNIKLLSSDVGMLIDEVDAMQKTQDENSTMTMSAMTELYEIALMMGGNS